MDQTIIWVKVSVSMWSDKCTRKEEKMVPLGQDNEEARWAGINTSLRASNTHIHNHTHTNRHTQAHHHHHTSKEVAPYITLTKCMGCMLSKSSLTGRVAVWSCVVFHCVAFLSHFYFC